MIAEIRGHQRGDVLDYVNTTEAKIPAMTVLQIGDVFGVVAGDIEPGQLGAAYVEGVFRMPKAAGEIAQGAKLAFAEDGVAAGDGLGYAFAPAAADDELVAVKING